MMANWMIVRIVSLCIVPSPPMIEVERTAPVYKDTTFPEEMASKEKPQSVLLHLEACRKQLKQARSL